MMRRLANLLGDIRLELAPAVRPEHAAAAVRPEHHAALLRMLDTVQDSPAFWPVIVPAVVCLTLVAMLGSVANGDDSSGPGLIAELVAMRAMLERNRPHLLVEQPPLVGALLLADMLLEVLERGIHGEAVAPRELDRLITEAHRLVDYRRSQQQVDRFAEERQWCVTVLERWRAELDSPKLRVVPGGRLTLGKRIQLVLDDRQWTHEHLAELMGVSRHAVDKWCNDVRHPGRERIPRLVRVLRVPRAYLED
jgi:hypothetical protein